MDESSRFLSLEEAANLLSVNYQLIYKLVRSGEIPAVKLGRIYRIDKGDLDAFIEASKTGATQVSHSCSSCHKGYGSRQSLTSVCKECEEPICFDCASRLGVEYCSKHQAKE